MAISHQFLKSLLFFLPLSACKLNRLSSDSALDSFRQKKSVSSLGTRTPYPIGDAKESPAIEQAPEDFKPIFVQSLARHGSRGLSSREDDVISYNIAMEAKRLGQLTELGKSLEKDLEELITVNSCLGVNNPEVKNPGYGNLSKRGEREHMAIASRLRNRHKEYFSQALTPDLKGIMRPVVVYSSGVDRAVDSSESFKKGFSLANGVASGNVFAGISGVNPDPKPNVNPFLLYFHKIKKESLPTESFYKEVFDASQDYQRFKKGEYKPQGLDTLPTLEEKVDNVWQEAGIKKASKSLLKAIYTEDFIALLDKSAQDKQLKFDNVLKGFVPQGSDGKACPVPALKSSGPEQSSSVEEAAIHLYEALSIGPALSDELGGKSFDRYLPKDLAKKFEFYGDVEDFYAKGPGMKEYNGITYNIAKGLVKDFFAQVDRAVMQTESAPAGIFRFAHAETVIPFVALLRVANNGEELSAAKNFSYDDNEWRGYHVSPLAANIQWEVYRNQGGTVLVRMLQNEYDAKFKSACKKALYKNTKYFYEFEKLKLCHEDLLGGSPAIVEKAELSNNKESGSGPSSKNGAGTGTKDEAKNNSMVQGMALYAVKCASCHDVLDKTSVKSRGLEVISSFRSKSEHKNVSIEDQQLDSISKVLPMR